MERNSGAFWWGWRSHASRHAEGSVSSRGSGAGISKWNRTHKLMTRYTFIYADSVSCIVLSYSFRAFAFCDMLSLSLCSFSVSEASSFWMELLSRSSFKICLLTCSRFSRRSSMPTQRVKAWTIALKQSLTLDELIVVVLQRCTLLSHRENLNDRALTSCAPTSANDELQPKSGCTIDCFRSGNKAQHIRLNF